MDPTDSRLKPQISRRTMAFRPQNVVGKKLGPITSTPAKPFPKPDYRMPGPSTQIPSEVLAKKFKPRPNSMEALIAASSSVLMASTNPSAKTTAGTSRTSMVNGNLPVSTVRSESPLFEDVKTPSVARIDSPVPDEGVTVPDQNPTLFSPGSSDASNLNPEKKPKVRPWTFEESMTYYECLKIHGKDFDQVMKALEKRNFPCDKTKLKNYYFNTHKLLRQQLQLDEKDMEPLSKDARELFTMINHFEYKKRTNNAKMMPEKMKQLIFQGTTSVKIQKKAVVIKTPSCPCLMKLFQGVRFYDKIPPSVTVIMRPLTYSDANFVRSARQNPFLKLKLDINDSIDRIFKLLELKWNQNSNSALSLETRTSQIKLFTARKTEIGRLVPVEGDFSPAVAMSLNKLKRDCLEREKLKQAADGNSFSISAHPTYSVIYPNPFILTEKMFEEGLDKENVKHAVIAELFCTCGMTENIELCYSVKSSSEPTEALTVLLSLLKRDYGDALVKNDLVNNLEPGNAGSVTKKRWTNELEAEGQSTPIAAKSTPRASIDKGRPSDVGLKLFAPIQSTFVQPESTPSTSVPVKVVQEKPPIPSKPPPVVVESTIVNNEVDAFLKQAQGLISERKRKNPAPQKHTPHAKIVRQSGGNTPAQPSNKGQETKMSASTPKEPPQTVLYRIEPEKRQGTRLSASRNLQHSKTNGSKMATDFSQFVSESSNSSSHLLAPCSSSQGMKTPEKQPQASDRQTRSMKKKQKQNGGKDSLNDEERERALLVDRLFGEISLSPTQSRGGQSTSQFELMHGSKSRDMLEKIMYECSMTPSKAGISQGASSISGLPEDVRKSMYDMMNTDSQDYVQNFAQLVDKLQNTPKKARNSKSNGKRST